MKLDGPADAGMLVFLIGLTLAAASLCCASVRGSAVAVAPTPFCAVIEARNRGRVTTGLACAETERDCRDVVTTAKRYGGLVGVVAVGECRTGAR